MRVRSRLDPSGHGISARNGMAVHVSCGELTRTAGSHAYNTTAAHIPTVSRDAARAGFEAFVTDAIDYTADAFSVSRALRRGSRGLNGAVLDKLVDQSDALWRHVVEPELDAHRTQIISQFDILLDYVESDENIDAYRDPLLSTDAYVDALRDDLPASRRDAIRDAAVERQRRFGDALEPLVAAPQDDFWPAVTHAYDRDTAETLVANHFAFTGLLRDHRDAFQMSTAFDASDLLGGVGSLLGGLPTVTVDYTDEALRAMERAERKVVADAERELDRRY
jgi:hypothetical protein